MNALNLPANLTDHHIEGIAREGNTPFTVSLISHVDGNLWQGGCENRVSLNGQFKHVISLYPWERYSAGCELDTDVSVRLLDGPVVPDEKQLYAIAGLVNVCRNLGPTLVHCQAGLNRSGLVAGLALVIGGMQPADAIALLRKNRSRAVLCNKSFEQWLLKQKP